MSNDRAIRYCRLPMKETNPDTAELLRLLARPGRERPSARAIVEASDYITASKRRPGRLMAYLKT